jgi:ATP-dependent DNA ligase
MQKSELFFGCGRSLFKAVCDFDLEGIIAKRLHDAYEPGRTKSWKVLNLSYSQKGGRKSKPVT